MSTPTGIEQIINQSICEIYIRYFLDIMPGVKTIFTSIPGHEINYTNGLSKIEENQQEIIIFNINTTSIQKLKSLIKDNAKRKIAIVFDVSDLDHPIIEFLAKKDINITCICRYNVVDKKKLFTSSQTLPYLDLDNIDKIATSVALQTGHQIDPSLSRSILLLSGGQTTTTTEIFKEIFENGESQISDHKKLLKNQEINRVYSDIFEILSRESIANLIKLNIINKNGSLFSKLFEEYLDTFGNPDLKTLFPSLTQGDIRLLTVFLKNPDKIIPRQTFELLSKKALSLDLDWSSYKAIERMKNKLKGIVLIKMIKGKGWILITKK